MRRCIAVFFTIAILMVIVTAQVPQRMMYQGKLTDASGIGESGSFSITFVIFNAEGGPDSLWAENHPTVDIERGLFAVLLGETTALDIPFDEPYWLEIRIDGTPVSPRARLTTSPYAFRALIADSVVGGSASDIDWTISTAIGDGVNDTTLVSGGKWGLFREGNTAYGDACSTHVNLGVGGVTGRDVYNNKYCTVSGGLENTARDTGTTVSGGESNSAIEDYSAVGGGKENTASEQYATVIGGVRNTASGRGATVSGGIDNLASNTYSMVGGGQNNISSDYQTVVGGGLNNSATGMWCTVGGGNGNSTNNRNATVSGGSSNHATQDYATVGGGGSNTASARKSTVSGGEDNTATGESATVGGGIGNRANDRAATIAGGKDNIANYFATTSGGYRNTASADYTAVVGGWNNTASANYAAINGGKDNHASGAFATIPGGRADTVSGNYSFAFGYHTVVATDYTARFFSADYPGAFCVGGDIWSENARYWGISTGSNADTFFIYADTNATAVTTDDTIRFDGNMPIKIGHSSLIVGTDGNVRITGDLIVDGSYPIDNDWTISGSDMYSAVSGNVGIGTASPGYKLEVNGDAANATGVWAVVSDQRFKKEIKPIRDALATVVQLEGVTFRWKDSDRDARYGCVHGLIAQQVEEVLPEWVRTDADGFKQIETIGIDAVLIEAIKELKAENDALKARIEALENNQ